MGLDMNPMAAPKPGLDAEFDRVISGLRGHDGGGPGGFWQRLFRRPPQDSRESLVARFQEITIPPFANLGAPVVGQDRAADDWIAEQFRAGRLGPAFASVEAAIAAFSGRYMVEMLPEHDGFPIYSNASLGAAERMSFRGEFLKDCTDVLDRRLIDQAWEMMTASELQSYGQALSERAAAYANAQGVAHVLGIRDAEWQTERAPEAQAHITDSLARWAGFWSAKGHGSEPDF